MEDHMNIPTLTRNAQIAIGLGLALAICILLFGCAGAPTQSEPMAPASLTLSSTTPVTYRVTCDLAGRAYECQAYVAGEPFRRVNATTFDLTYTPQGQDVDLSQYEFSFKAKYRLSYGQYSAASQKIRWFHDVATGNMVMRPLLDAPAPGAPLASAFHIVRMP
jgi:hypothetical protein